MGGDKMYNEERKRKYIDEVGQQSYPQYTEQVETIFKKISVIEEERKKDYCDFNMEEAIDAVSTISTRKKTTLEWTLHNLRDYGNWCIANMYCDSNPIDGVTYKDIELDVAVKQETVPNIEYFRKIVEMSFDEINEDVSMNTIYKLFAFLLYLGLTEEEVLNITIEEASNLDGDKLHYNGRKIYIPFFVKEYIDRISKAKQIVWQKGAGDPTYRDLLESDKLIRSIYTMDSRLQNMKNALVKFNKNYMDRTGNVIKLSIVRIYESGVYYRLLEHEILGGKITAETVQRYFNIDKKDYGEERHYRVRLNNIMMDYLTWKKVWKYTD